MAQFGELAVELDALEPETLQEILRTAIEEHIDLDVYEKEKEEEENDNEQIDERREQIRAILKEE